MEDLLTIGGRQFHSRMLVGTGKFANHDVMAQALVASRAEIVTVALRRVEATAELDRIGGEPDRNGTPMGADSGRRSLVDYLPPSVALLPNTSGALTAREAVMLARLGRAGYDTDLVKLEVTPDPRTLAPDPIETLKAAETLVRDGFTVLPYCSADPVLCKHLEEAGCATVMPLGAWIGSNRGLRTRDAIEAIVAAATVPVVVDAGLGVPSDAAEAMEIGADAVLVNTAIAVARDPVAMARAFAMATEAGRLGYLAGRGPVLAATQSEASSPLTGFLGSPGPGAGDQQLAAPGE
jgi:thiazole synthase